MTTTVVKPTAIAGSTWCNSGCIYPPALRMRFETYSVYVMSSTRWKSGKTPVPDACSSVLCQTNSCQASGHESSMSSFRRTLYLRVFVRWLPSTEESYHRIIRKAIPTSTLLFQHGRWGRRGSIPRKTVSTTNGPTLKYGVGLGLGYKTGHTRGATSKSASVTKAYESKGSRENPPRHVSYVDLQRGERQRRIQAKELARELARLERNRELSREKTKTHSR